MRNRGHHSWSLLLVLSAEKVEDFNVITASFSARVRSVLKPAVVVNLPKEYVKGCGEVPPSSQCCGRAAFHKLPWYVEDVWNDLLFPIRRHGIAYTSGKRTTLGGGRGRNHIGS